MLKEVSIEFYKLLFDKPYVYLLLWRYNAISHDSIMNCALFDYINSKTNSRNYAKIV